MPKDWSVGQILGAIRNNGLDDNTLVVFASDNGPWLLYGDHAGSSGPYREGKATVFDGGLRSPCIMRWPGKIPAGTECKELAVTFDLLPTIARLAGATGPTNRIIDGRDIWPLMTGASGARTPHDTFYYYWGGHLQAVRKGSWKLHLGHGYPKPEPAGHDGKPGKYAQKEIGLALYNLEKDPAESNDVTAANPDVVRQLQAVAETAREDLGDSISKRAGKNVREPGRIETPNPPVFQPINK